MPALEAAGLTKKYGPVQALAGVDLTVEEGETVALLGPNGAGKTTTLEILEGFRSPTSGTVTVLGSNPLHRDRRLRERVGVVLQETAVEPYLTVDEVLTRNSAYYPHPRPIDEVVGLVGLGKKRRSLVRTLSGGQQRRLDVALGIIGRPELLFLDEPTTGFDPSARREAWSMIQGLREAGTTILLTTHYMEEAQFLADRLIVIAQGRIVAEGTPSTLGGREEAMARVSFRLPPGVPERSLPVTVTRLAGDIVEVRTEDEVTLLHRLTGWALERHVPLPGLTVSRPTLEEIYLSLVEEDPDA